MARKKNNTKNYLKLLFTVVFLIIVVVCVYLIQQPRPYSTSSRAALYVPTTQFGNAIQFNPDSYIISNNSTQIDPQALFTVEAWTKLEEPTVQNNIVYYTILSKDFFSFDVWATVDQYPGTQNYTVSYWFKHNITAEYTFVYSTLMDRTALTSWHHIAFTLPSDIHHANFFLDGTLHALQFPIASDNLPTPGPIYIGAKHENGHMINQYHGLLDELRISNVVRYTNSFTPPTSPFIPDANTLLLYHFDQQQNNVIQDYSGNHHDAVIYGSVQLVPNTILPTETPTPNFTLSVSCGRKDANGNYYPQASWTPNMNLYQIQILDTDGRQWGWAVNSSSPVTGRAMTGPRTIYAHVQPVQNGSWYNSARITCVERKG
jgi:hypothetical protein